MWSAARRVLVATTRTLGSGSTVVSPITNRDSTKCPRENWESVIASRSNPLSAAILRIEDIFIIKYRRLSIARIKFFFLKGSKESFGKIGIT